MKLNSTANSFEIAHDIDVLESSVLRYDKALLGVLLSDKSSGKNILWATTDYCSLGYGYEEFSEITADLVTGEHSMLIQPRITKTQNEQEYRTRNMAEVFTPSWICNSQNNLIDTKWFGRTDVFNRETGTTWIATHAPISFEGTKKGWQKYVDAQRLEISCGEAPYLVSRYDTVTGARIPTHARIGLLDRKMRVVNENAKTDSDWMKWSQRAFESVFGYEYQGDSLLLARENLLLSYMDYYKSRFGITPNKAILRKIALIIAWNIWQMDGQKGVVPGSCHEEADPQGTLFGEVTCACPGCIKGDIRRHNGIYCRIQDWRFKKSRLFVSLMKGGKMHAGI